MPAIRECRRQSRSGSTARISGAHISPKRFSRHGYRRATGRADRWHAQLADGQLREPRERSDESPEHQCLRTPVARPKPPDCRRDQPVWGTYLGYWQTPLRRSPESATVLLDGFVYERIAPYSPRKMSRPGSMAGAPTGVLPPAAFRSARGCIPAQRSGPGGQGRVDRQSAASAGKPSKDYAAGAGTGSSTSQFSTAGNRGGRSWVARLSPGCAWARHWRAGHGPQVTSPSDVMSSYHPLIHVLDVFLPVVDLGVESRWTIDTTAAAGSPGW